MPDLDRFYREAADKAAILGVVLASDEGPMRGLVMKEQYSFPILLDQGAAVDAYNVRFLPAVFVIDAAGNLVDRFVGPSDFDRLNEIADGLAGG